MATFVQQSGDARDGDLYPLTADPHELHNLWSDKTHADVIARLEARIRQRDWETKA